jgi:hypothetical protein
MEELKNEPRVEPKTWYVEGTLGSRKKNVAVNGAATSSGLSKLILKMMLKTLSLS